MKTHKDTHLDYEGSYFNADANIDESDYDDIDLVNHKRVRRMLEDRIERKRLKEELEDYEGELDEFDWNNLERK